MLLARLLRSLFRWAPVTGVFGAGFVLALGPLPAAAPVPVDNAAAQQQFQLSGAAPFLILAPDSPGSEPSLLDKEFGVQQLVIRPARQDDRYFRADLGGFFTTNAAQIHRPEISDWVGVSSLLCGWVPELAPGLRFQLSGEQRFWRFADTQELDFDEFGGRAGLWWEPFPGRTPLGIPVFSAWAQYRYQGLFRPLTWDDVLYDTHFVEAGARRAIPLDALTTALIELNAAHSVDGGPDFLRRDEYTLSLALLHTLSDRAALGLAVSNSWRPYHPGDREDWNQFASVFLRRALTQNLIAQAGVSAGRNESNLEFFDYKSFNAELGMKLQLTW